MERRYDADFVRLLVGGEPWRPGSGLIVDRADFCRRHDMPLATLNQQLNGRVNLSLDVVHAAQAEAEEFPVYEYLLNVERTRPAQGTACTSGGGGDLGYELLLRLGDFESAVGRYAESLVAAVAEDSDGGASVTRHELAILEPLAHAVYERVGAVCGQIRAAREAAEGKGARRSHRARRAG